MSSYSKAEDKVLFLDEKIRELDCAIQELVATSSPSEGSRIEYTSRMEQIKQRKVKRLQVAQKRLEYQVLAVEAEFEAKVLEQSISLNPTESKSVQKAFSKRRSMIEVDRFVERVRLEQRHLMQQPHSGNSQNWLEDDLRRINIPV